MDDFVDMTADEIREETRAMTTEAHTPSGNIIAAYKLGNTKIIVRDTYIDDKNIKGLEAALEGIYPNVKFTVTRG